MKRHAVPRHPPPHHNLFDTLLSWWHSAGTAIGFGSVAAIGGGRARRVVRTPLGRSQGRHGLILGATGSGKTVTEAAIAQWHMRAGNAVIAIDPKGDRFLARTLQQEAAARGVPFRAFSPT